MARKPSALAGIFDDEPTQLAPLVTPIANAVPEPVQDDAPRRARRTAIAPTTPARRSSHPGKKPVLIHIPEDMHRALRQLSVEEGGEPLTVITERLLRQYLVKRGHTRFGP
jgi:hypothetical protein